MKFGKTRKILIFSIFQLVWIVPLSHAEPVASSNEPYFVGTEGSEIRQLWDSGDKKAAEKRLRDWEDRDEKSGEPLVMAAIFQFEKKEFKKCLSLCEKALSRSPQLAEAYYWRGRAYEALDKPVEALNEYRAAVLAKGTFPAAEERIARVDAMGKALDDSGKK